MKDNFSTHSAEYARYRPEYPQAFYNYLQSLVKHKQVAWDCGTGNGQVAYALANFFDCVYATDISASQLKHAKQHHQITYSCQAAEQTDFPDNFFDLIVVAQAIHWFNFNKFYAEAKRTLKDTGNIVIVGYGLITIDESIDKILHNFYFNIIGPYWDKERKYIDDNYATIPFPFSELEAPKLHNQFDWTLDHLLGYLKTWSAVKHFIKARNYNPVEIIDEDLMQHWGSAETKVVKFPILLRAGMK